MGDPVGGRHPFGLLGPRDVVVEVVVAPVRRDRELGEPELRPPPAEAAVLTLIDATKLSVECVQVAEVPCPVGLRPWVESQDGEPKRERIVPVPVEGGGFPLGSRIQRAKSRGSTSPYVNVIPLITMFRRRTRLSAR